MKRSAPAHALIVALALIALLLGANVFRAPAGQAAAQQLQQPAPATVPSQFDPGRVRKGQLLAAAGDCASCHTTATGASLAGGVPLATPFGTIHGTNITPDRETGIGAWTEDDFRRAMREGISRDGHRLYPAFPYNHFTRMSDDDIGSLYAYLMTRIPVRQQATGNQLRFPFGFRPLVAFWNMLYLDKGPYQPVANQSAEWNRGAYLAQSVGHCGACHTPRNRLGGERRDSMFGGGQAESWHATALNANSPSPVPWTVDNLVTYLRTGIAPDHAMAAGPMRAVVENMARVDEADVRAIATYIASQMGGPTPERQAREADARQRAQAGTLASVAPNQAGGKRGDNDPQMMLGASVYASSCAACHDLGRGLSSDTALRLPLAVALHMPDPRNLIHIVREGIQPAAGETGRWMPAFAGTLTDEQAEALVVWLRRTGTNAAPWTDVSKAVKDTGEAP